MKTLKISIIFILLILWKTGIAQAFQMPSEIKKGQLKNGMTYFLIPDGNPGKVKLTILTKVGSFLERPDQHGYAHMVEHMLFKGSKNYPGNACMEELELMGMRIGIDYNGYTGISSTEYFVTIPESDKDYFTRSLSLLKDWMFYLQMDEAILENEKKVITEEISRAGGDQAGSPNLLGTSLEGHSSLGTKESVRNATSEGLYRFYKDNYVPSNMALIVHGEINTKFAEKWIKQVFSKETAAEGYVPNQYIDINNTNTVSGDYGKDKDIEPDKLAILFKEKPIAIKDYTSFKANLSRKMMIQMLNRRLSELLGKSVKKLSVNMGSVIPGNAVYNFRMDLSADSSYDFVFQLFCKALAQVKQHGFTSEEIEAVNVMEDQFIKRRRSVYSDWVNKVQAYFISGNMPLEQGQFEGFTYRALGELTSDDYKAMVNHMLDLKKIILYDSTSKACSNDFNETTILEYLENLDTIPIKAYRLEDRRRGIVSKRDSEPLDFEMDIRQSEAVKKEKQLAKGLKELIYLNGIKVVLYDSETEKANVKLMSSRGLSYVPKDERSSFKQSIRNFTSAYGQYNIEDARAIERSRGIIKTTSINYYSYQLNVSGESSDMEQLLKLFNLLITEPAYPETEEVINSLEQRIRRRNQDEKIDTPNSEVVLNEALVTRLIQYDRDIKSDIGGTVILVQGKLPKGIEELVSKYLGSLPSKQNTKLPLDTGEDIVLDSMVYTNVTWKRDLAKIGYYFRNGSKKELTLRDELILQGVKEYAHLYMTNVIRKKYGMVYATGNNAGVYNNPISYSMLRLAFMTDTSNVDRAYEIMDNEVLTPLSKIKLSDTEVEKVKAMLRSIYVMSFYEDKRISNEWLTASLKYSKVYSPKELDAMIKSVTRKDLEQCMYNMINLDCFEIMTHLPE